MAQKEALLEDDPLWYKDAIIYELHIKAFFDSNGDGIGDFKGLTRKLDYLKDLGITAIWLLPFYPSPLKDDGYDISDYFNVHPAYGTLRDFKEFLKEAHERGIRVITELVLNHTSDQHLWFRKARKSGPNSASRKIYVWSQTPEKYSDARIIFQDFEASNWTWDGEAKAYYWHRFYSHQPDLNFDNPQVQKALFRVIDFWMELGVDGVRLDAVPYLFEREGTNCENLPETYDYLRKLRAHVDAKFKNRMLLAEANQWPEDAVAYLGRGDICHMAFHFPLMPRMFMALQMEDNFPIIDIMDETPHIPESCQWALFLRNHDELTLEMVTDEERDYMYRMYARDPKSRINVGIRRRLAPLLENDSRKVRLMYLLLFSLPGAPVIYYGNEIGMGDNYYLGDRDGVRTPMQWSPDRNAGFSTANPQQLYLPPIIDPAYHYETINVETQEKSHSSFLWWVRRLISMRKRFKAFGRGSIELLYPDNRKIFAFVREYMDEKILVAVNLSRYAQVARLDLSKFSGFIPEEMFSKNKFIPIKDAPYVLTFAPYSSFLFLLKEEGAGAFAGTAGEGVELNVSGDWTAVLEGRGGRRLASEVLPAYVGGCRWYGGKARELQELRIIEAIPIGRANALSLILLMELEYTEGTTEIYSLPVAFAQGEKALDLVKNNPRAVIAKLKTREGEGVLFDGVYSEDFCREILSAVARRRKFKARSGEFLAYPGVAYKEAAKGREYLLKPQVLKGEQSNTSILYGADFFLKIYRHPGEGPNPDMEIIRFLTEKAAFPNIPSFAGGIEYRKPGSEPIVLGMLQSFVQNQGDSWKYYLEILNRYYERALAEASNTEALKGVPQSLFEIAQQGIPPFFKSLLTEVPIELVGLLGKRTAELHLALFSDKETPPFAPERFSLLWQKSVFRSMQSLVKKNFSLLKKVLPTLPEDVRSEALQVLEMEKKVMEGQRGIARKKYSGTKIRVHGDYHLGQVLFTGKDFVIIDFEGEPARGLGERRLKKSPLNDVAGMIRSFHYAAYFSLLKEAHVRHEDIPTLEPWADQWYRLMAGAFLKSYLDTVGGSGLIPENREELEIVLSALLLDKAVYELGYELNNRPEWVIVPLRGIRYLLGDTQQGERA